GDRRRIGQDTTSPRGRCARSAASPRLVAPGRRADEPRTFEGEATMMSQALYRLGRFAARRAWVVIGSWLVLSVLVIGASSVFGHKLVDSPAVPRLGSQPAPDLLAAAQAGHGRAPPQG